MASNTLKIGHFPPGTLPPGDGVLQRPFQPTPELQTLLEQVKVLGNDLDDLTPEKVAAAREVREKRAERCLWKIPVESVRDFIVPSDEHSVPVRVYIPDDKQLARDGKLPVVVFFHGGGWTLGSPSIYDSITRQLARQIPALVISVDYRLAPENSFPAAVHDADTVLDWVRRSVSEIGGDPARIVVAGDSGGGTLATVSARHGRDWDGPPIILQVLIYPSTNISSIDYDSYRQYGKEHLLTQKAVESFRQFYLPNPSDWTCPDASPLLATNLKGMPAALIIGAGCDPLRDEGEAYSHKLREHGVEVIYRVEPQLIHAFLNLYNLFPNCSPYAEAVLGYAAGVIRTKLASKP